MKIIFLVVSMLAVAQAALIPSDAFYSQPMPKNQLTEITDNLDDGTFITRLDHTRPTDIRTVQFGYVVNREFYQEGGPLYVYLKDLGDFSTKWITEGLMHDIAQETRGALFTFDYRYFGQNLPVEEFTFENLQFLTIEQILGDISTFIRFIRTGMYGTKVIVWGSGVGGTLSAWSRKKFPHLIDAAWSSSGLFDLELNTFSFYDYMQYQFLTGAAPTTTCRDQVLEAFQTIDQMVTEGDSEGLQDRLNLCFPVATENVQDVAQVFIYYLHYINQFINTYQINGLRAFCRDMNALPDALSSLTRWMQHVYNANDECIDHSYNNTVERSSDVTTTNEGRRSWYYLQCTQAGLFRSTNEFTWLPNRIPLDYHYRICQDVLGDSYEPEILPINIEASILTYGSYGQRVSNIVYTNGVLDPWIYSSMLTTMDYNATILNIDYHAKSADLESIHLGDSAYLNEAKDRIVEEVKFWSDPFT